MRMKKNEREKDGVCLERERDEKERETERERKREREGERRRERRRVCENNPIGHLHCVIRHYRSQNPDMSTHALSFSFFPPHS